MMIAWTQKPAAVLITVQPLTGTVDGIDHQQVTALGLELSAAVLKKLLFGACQGGKSQNRLPQRTSPHQCLKQIRHQFPTSLNRANQLVFRQLLNISRTGSA